MKTGADIIAALEAEAERSGVSTFSLANQLSRYPHKWLKEVARAQKPTANTIARVTALLGGSDLPPTHNSGRRRTFQRVVRQTIREPELPTGLTPVDRDPCFRCGVRADIGCMHRPWTMERAA